MVFYRNFVLANLVILCDLHGVLIFSEVSIFKSIESYFFYL